MNAFKEPVTPRNSSVPVQKSVLHHFKRPAGRGGLIRSDTNTHHLGCALCLVAQKKDCKCARTHTGRKRENIVAEGELDI